MGRWIEVALAGSSEVPRRLFVFQVISLWCRGTEWKDGASLIPGLYLNAIDVSSTSTTKLFESVVYFYLTFSYSVQLKLASSPALSKETALPVFISSVWKIDCIFSDTTLFWHFCSIWHCCPFPPWNFFGFWTPHSPGFLLFGHLTLLCRLIFCQALFQGSVGSSFLFHLVFSS